MSQRGRERDINKERYWRDAIRRWESSGRSICGLCREQGLAEVSFSTWRRIIALRDERASSATPVDRVPVFVPLRLPQGRHAQRGPLGSGPRPRWQ